MREYEKKIRDYKRLIQTQYVKATAVEDVMQKCALITEQIGESVFDERLTFFEFLYGQLKFIQKRWWLLQGGVLILIWILFSDLEGQENALRMLPAMSAMFAILVIPEMWKNRRFSATEIEKTTLYSLRQIYAARLLLFAAADLAMMTIFFVITFNTIQIDIYKIVINFLIPFNVSCCICFRLLYSKGHDIEYIAAFLNVICVSVWSVIAGTEFIYQRIAVPLWIGLIMLSFGYLVYCIRRSQRYCELIGEEQTNGITI